jgi:hypothetical protein
MAAFFFAIATENKHLSGQPSSSKNRKCDFEENSKKLSNC